MPQLKNDEWPGEGQPTTHEAQAGATGDREPAGADALSNRDTTAEAPQTGADLKNVRPDEAID